MRADKFFAEKFGSRTKAADALEKGWVLANGKPLRPKDEVSENAVITFVEEGDRYVSNGGYKLARALEKFAFAVEDLTFADIGASTGGFTDCLLQNGAKRVYAVDVGDSQLHEKIAVDSRVTVMDHTNARYLQKSDFDEPIDGIVTDVSFISLRLIFPTIAEVLDEDGFAVTLIKPQFECENKNIGKSGIVHPSAHADIVEKVVGYANENGLFLYAVENAPIRKGKNIEYVALWKKRSGGLKNYETIAKIKELVKQNSLGTLL
jgi:23S rRNA (cytidine1920-2'-O)/16S rRNA (cytidine1409-2'-O)-methyltransferase